LKYKERETHTRPSAQYSQHDEISHVSSDDHFAALQSELKRLGVEMDIKLHLQPDDSNQFLNYVIFGRQQKPSIKNASIIPHFEMG
jgi:hypothetical protein